MWFRQLSEIFYQQIKTQIQYMKNLFLTYAYEALKFLCPMQSCLRS